jgi:dihydroorotase
MSILIKSAKIIDASSKFNGKTKDIFIKQGVIQEIDDKIVKKSAKEINLDNLHISQGWLDSSVCFGEPGLEERETIENGSLTACLSGFTDIILNSNTLPVIDSKADVIYVKSKNKNKALKIHPLGALTVKSEGSEMAELHEMFDSGAVGFYDYKTSVKNPNLLKTALQYVQHFDGLIMTFPFEKSICQNGQMNEGEISTLYGLEGIPSLSEEITLERDLKILEYTGGKLFIPTISTTKSVELIKNAKRKGLQIMTSVSINNIFFNEEKLINFDTRFKILPPLRSEEDRLILVNALSEGIIDFCTSDHCPIDIDNKKTDFKNSLFGATGLESVFGALNSLYKTEKVIEILTRKKDLFGIKNEVIDVGSKACMTLFNPKNKYIFTKSHVRSKSKNASFINSEIKGKVYGIINNGHVVLDE